MPFGSAAYSPPKKFECNLFYSWTVVWLLLFATTAVRVKGYKTHWTTATEVFISAAFLSRSSASWTCRRALSASSTSTRSRRGHNVDPALETRPKPKQWQRVLHGKNYNLQPQRKTHHAYHASSVLFWNKFKILAFCKLKLKMFVNWKQVQFGSSLNFQIQSENMKSIAKTDLSCKVTGTDHVPVCLFNNHITF